MLQVLEHLTPKQIEVCNEIKRISKRFIISVPFLWSNSPSEGHNDIDIHDIKNWTGLKPYKIEIVGNRERKRIICMYRGF
jgi:hypothetical protein